MLWFHYLEFMRIKLKLGYTRYLWVNRVSADRVRGGQTRVLHPIVPDLTDLISSSEFVKWVAKALNGANFSVNSFSVVCWGVLTGSFLSTSVADHWTSRHPQSVGKIRMHFTERTLHSENEDHTSISLLKKLVFRIGFVDAWMVSGWLLSYAIFPIRIFVSYWKGLLFFSLCSCSMLLM